VGIDLSDTTTRGIVTVIASGTGVASQTYTDNRTCTITVLGSGFPTYTPYDAVLNEDNPVSHWKLGDANTAIDRRQTLNLPAISGPISTATGLVANNANDQSNVFTGVANVSFDAGSGGILGVPYQGAYTMEAWVKPTVDASSAILKRTAGTFLGLGDTGNGTQVQVQFSFANSANAVFSLLSPSSYFLTINKTYHIVGTYDGTTAILYINGIEAIVQPPSEWAVFGQVLPSRPLLARRMLESGHSRLSMKSPGITARLPQLASSPTIKLVSLLLMTP
jgi:hypothetical protein